MAKAFTADPTVMKEMAEDEKLLWMGAPETFPLMSEENKKGFTTRWLICIVAAVALVVAWILLSATTDNLNAWLPILLLLVVAYFALIPMLDRGNVNKCRYYVTDRRVILHYADKDIYSLPLKGTKRAISPAAPGCVHIDLGACVGIKASKRRVASFAVKKDDKENAIGMVIYNVEDSENLRKLFS